MPRSDSYRAIVRSSSIMGTASALNVANSLIRMKIAAILLGPVGVGLVGLYQNVVSAASTVTALGIGTVGTRQIADASAQGDAAEMAAVRRALFWGSLLLASIGGLLFFLLRKPLAESILDAPDRAPEVGMLALGVVLTVIAGSQAAVLNGLRRIGDLARLQVLSGLVATVLGCAVMLLWGEAGILALVLAGPLGSCVLGYWYVARLGRVTARPPALRALWRQWGMLARLGVPFMLSGLVNTLALLAVRSLVQRDLGVDELGYFQAAWQISATYLGVVLGAMATDYYPRLVACIGDRAEMCQLINEQTAVALLLAGPLVLFLLAMTPWIIRLLYTAEFMPAVDILRWQLLGDVLKLMSFPLGFVLLAAGSGKTFVVTETCGMAVFVLGTALALPVFGIAATGMAFLAMYVVYLSVVYVVVKRRFAFTWASPIIWHAAAVQTVGIAIVLSARISDFLAAGLGVAAAASASVYGVSQLGKMTGVGGRLAGLAERARRILPAFDRDNKE